MGTGYALLQVNSALHPFGVAKSSTSFGWGKGGNVTSVGWQVTLCESMIWHVSSRSGEAGLFTKGEPIYRVYLLYLLQLEVPQTDSKILVHIGVGLLV